MTNVADALPEPPTQEPPPPPAPGPGDPLPSTGADGAALAVLGLIAAVMIIGGLRLAARYRRSGRP